MLGLTFKTQNKIKQPQVQAGICSNFMNAAWNFLMKVTRQYRAQRLENISSTCLMLENDRYSQPQSLCYWNLIKRKISIRLKDICWPIEGKIKKTYQISFILIINKVLSHTLCYSLNVWVSPQFLCWQPNLKVMALEGRALGRLCPHEWDLTTL